MSLLSGLVSNEDPRPFRIHEVSFDSISEFLKCVRKFNITRPFRQRSRSASEVKFSVNLCNSIEDRVSVIPILPGVGGEMTSNFSSRLGGILLPSHPLMKERIKNNLHSLLFVPQSPTHKTGRSYSLFCVVETCINFPHRKWTPKDESPPDGKINFRMNVQVTDLSFGIPRNFNIYPNVSLAICGSMRGSQEMPLLMIGDILFLKGVELRKNVNKQSCFLDLTIDLNGANSNITVFRTMEAHSMHNLDGSDFIRFSIQVDKQPANGYQTILDTSAGDSLWESTSKTKPLASLLVPSPHQPPNFGNSSRRSDYMNLPCAYTNKQTIKMQSRSQTTISVLKDQLAHTMMHPERWDQFIAKGYEMRLRICFLSWLISQSNDITSLLSRIDPVNEPQKLFFRPDSLIRFVMDPDMKCDDYDVMWDKLQNRLLQHNLLDVGGVIMECISKNIINRQGTMHNDDEYAVDLLSTINSIYKDDMKLTEFHNLLGVKSANCTTNGPRDLVEPDSTCPNGSEEQQYLDIIRFLGDHIESVETINKVQWNCNYIILKEHRTGQFIAVTGFNQDQWAYMTSDCQRRYPQVMHEERTTVKFRAYNFLPILLFVKQQWIPVVAAEHTIEKYKQQSSVDPSERLINILTDRDFHHVAMRNKGVILYPRNYR
eukprot:GHVH01004204.1.p1 GENE.GHVH01004204.1~~GHVH01004204.1.p1  ORF type:complete len:656 (-),score=85.00 GHVH01004204.1:40-2007(-)